MADEITTISKSWVDRIVPAILAYQRSSDRDSILADSSMLAEETKAIDDTVNRVIRRGEGCAILTTARKVRIHIKFVFDGQLKWGLWGPDLALHFRWIPQIKIRVGRGFKFVKPVRGTNHSRWYNYDKTHKMMHRIVLELRALERFLENKVIGPRQMMKSSYEAGGTLDIEVEPDLTFLEKYDRVFDRALIDRVRVQSDMNPHKVANSLGLYIFKKNWTSATAINGACRSLNRHVPCFYPTNLRWQNEAKLDDAEKAEQLADQIMEFYSSEHLIALIAYAKHQRILVKDEELGQILMMDPSLKSGVDNHYVFRLLRDELADQNVSLVFQSRMQRDQPRGEASCSVAALARAIHLAMSYEMLKAEKAITTTSTTSTTSTVETTDSSADVVADDPKEEEDAVPATDEDSEGVKDEDSLIQALLKLSNEPLNDSVVIVATSLIRPGH
jgi:hypothetical protein